MLDRVSLGCAQLLTSHDDHMKIAILTLNEKDLEFQHSVSTLDHLFNATEVS